MNNSKIKIGVFYLLSALFILVNTLAIVYKNTLIVSGLPFLLLVVLFAFFAMDKLLMVIVFATPFSLPLSQIFPQLPFDMALPTEPLLFGLLLVFVFKQSLEKSYDRKVINHPVSYAIYFYLFWMLVTSITSTLPFVSLKFFLAKIWFIVAFYFLMVLFFQKREKIFTYYWAYLIPLFIVIVITIIKHSMHGFDQHSAHSVMHPFYKDHTSYGAVMAMYLPVLLGLFSLSKSKPILRWIIIAFTTIFVLGIILSYTRAAWVSLIGALGVFIVVKLKIHIKWLLLAFGFVVALFFVYKTDIMIQLEQNKTDSSTDFKEHVRSISNVATDASNKERINRWNCAIRMFKDKPYLGWGPGTYQFQYAPFQKSYEKTIISTNAGNMGNAHSEYLGPLSESGLLGMLSFLVVVLVVVVVALRRYKHCNDPVSRTLLLMSLTGLVTYFIHGILNNFLDTDKASVPFWGFIAIVVAVDLYHANLPEEKELESIEK